MKRILPVSLGVCLSIFSSTVHSRADVVTEPLRKFGLGDLQIAAISPDGKWMATGGGGGAFLWDFRTGTMVRRLEAHQAAVTSLCFSPSGVLLTAGRDTLIRAWDVESASELRSFAGHIGAIYTLSFAPDGQSFVSVGDNTARVWSFSTGKLLHIFSAPGEGVFDAKFAPDSRRLVTANLNFTNMTDNIRLWDLATGQKIRSFGGNGLVQKFEFVAGHLVTTKGALDAQVWDIESGQLIRSLPGMTPADFAIEGFLPSSNSPVVVAGCLGGRVITWDTSTGQIVNDFMGENLFSIAAVPGTNQLLIAHPDNIVRVKNSQSGTTLRAFTGHTTSSTAGVGLSPDRQYVLSGGSETLTRIWNRTNALQIRALAGYPGIGTAVARFSPDGTRILTTYGTPNFSARLSNTQTLALEREFFGHTSWLTAAVFSSDGRRVATGAQDGTARLWDVATGALIRTFSIPGSLVTAVALSSNGMMLASGDQVGFVRLWNTTNGQLLRSLQAPFEAGSVSCLDFSPTTGELLVGWTDGLLEAFDPATAAVKLDPLFAGGFLYDAGFSPDGRFILQAEGWPSFSARLLDARTGEELRVFAGHFGEVTSVAFDSTGTSIVTGAEFVRLWSIADIAARLETERKSNGLELRWSVGTLQQSARLNGPWQDVTNAVSPRLVPINQPSTFFRTKAPIE